MPQIFRTQSVGNNNPVFYQLSIRAPGFALSEITTYTFPLSPSQLRYDRSSLSSYSDTQGPPNTQGVTRVVDVYGLAPPVITIEGTTGWDQHLSDGFLLGGLGSINLLQAFLAKYASLNQEQIRSGSSQTYSLEFYDYFSSQFWVIEPIGPQIIRQANDRPMLTYYRFRWAAYRSVGLPVTGEADALLQVFGTPAAQQVVNAASTLGALLEAYSPIGPVAIANKLLSFL